MTKITHIEFTNHYVEDADGTFAHRRICAEHWGPIPDTWHVHHVNEIKDDNDPANLIALPKNFHHWLHRSGYQYEFLARQGKLSRALILALYAAYERKEFKLQQSLFTVLFDLGILRIHLP